MLELRQISNRCQEGVFTCAQKNQVVVRERTMAACDVFLQCSQVLPKNLLMKLHEPRLLVAIAANQNRVVR
ncbi:MAG: hypothetical protein ACREL9_14395 [Gemmatimonadales bacterium]